MLEAVTKERDEWKAKAEGYLISKECAYWKATAESYLKMINNHVESEESAKWSADQYAKVSARSNELSDMCGILRSETVELLAENATLRRRIEKLERKSP
jgi:hypothetical protein